MCILNSDIKTLLGYMYHSVKRCLEFQLPILILKPYILA